EFPVQVSTDRKLGDGTELGLGIGVAADPSEDVLSFVQESVPQAGRLICIIPETGSSNVAIGNDTDARAWALQTRDLVRIVVRRYRPAKIHLFLAAPHGAALLLGHLWDRMPVTQLYEDLGPGNGYLPCFL